MAVDEMLYIDQENMGDSPDLSDKNCIKPTMC